jgi:hypothetical protein
VQKEAEKKQSVDVDAGSRADADTDAGASLEDAMSTAEKYADMMRTYARFDEERVNHTFERMLHDKTIENEEISPFTAAIYAFSLGVSWCTARGMCGVCRWRVRACVECVGVCTSEGRTW